MNGWGWMMMMTGPKTRQSAVHSRAQVFQAMRRHVQTRAGAAVLQAPSRLPIVPLPRPAPHVLIYGGGAIGILHAGLMQMRLDYERRIRAAAATVAGVPQASASASAIAAPPADDDIGSVSVISSQADLISVLQHEGCTFDLLRQFVQRAEWMAPPTDANEPPLLPEDSSHVRLPPLRLAAARSAFDLPWVRRSPSDAPPIPPFTHVLLCSKGTPAFEHACRELLHLLRLQLLASKHHPLASVCVLMNGMGHEQRLLERVSALLDQEAEQPDTNGRLQPLPADQREEFVAHLRRQLVLATTTSGARLQKEHGRPPSGSMDLPAPLRSLRLVQGGAGVTTVLQNELEARDARHSASSSSALPSSVSVVRLLASIGQEAVLAPFASSAAVLYTKLLVNAVINPLTALYAVRNGALLEEKYTDEITLLAVEFVTVMAALQVRLAPIDKSACSSAVQHLAKFGLRRAKNWSVPRDLYAQLETALLHVLNVAERTAVNYSSMYTDLHPPGEEETAAAAPADASLSAHRQRRRGSRAVKSEIEQITGFLLQQATAAGVAAKDVRHHRRIFERVQARERQLNQNNSSQQMAPLTATGEDCA